ncbi:GDSL-like Lipase/Acylhydrolase family protein [Amycolatopsis arida]|uniref:GDSL-like Lipase/Acylhydrolase family protein n=1 Tax=Amycolatopsis arida TaxID=587909 RepID=A0A1I5M2Y9_9PSEU|nr:GDSL-type esterase/lipase family protein [Amycolatopsis arida]TDX93949.1 GDSL-like lipase/acylhydrolase family protein [Amycolatopsis arida]SFP03922.1 GDSL-like Lipase/Acylhydrolase family protein [Amycolatopsis arida]
MPDWITTPITADLLRGVLDLERTAHGVLPHRLPARARARFPDDYLAMVEAQPAGVRLAFRTRATAVELDVLPTRTAYRGMPAPPEGVFELLVDGRPAGRATVPGGNVHTIDMATRSATTSPGRPGTARFAGLPPGAKDVEIWLPHTEITELVALHTDAPVEPARDRGRRVWLHHGSSISHGSNADSPTASWPVLAANRGGVELVNLSLRGNALLDPFVARALRDTPADLISLKIGINLVNTDLMRLRGFTPAVHGFLDTIRDGHPSTPLVVVSPILCPIHEDTPGPGVADLDGSTLVFRAIGDPADRAGGRLTLTVIRDELARLVEHRAADDPNLHYLDGRALYGEPDVAELPLPDRLHPDTATHRRIAERFAGWAFAAGGPFAPGHG